MASAHGTFILHDRASRTLDRLQRKAAMTDAAFKRLALTMDSVGERKQVRQLDTYNRALGNVNRSSTILSRDNDRVSRSFRSAGREAESFGMRLRKVGATLISLRVIIGSLKLPAMAAAIGVLAQSVGALAGGIVALIPRLADMWGIIAPMPATFLGLAGAMVTAKLAFSGLGKAMSGNKDALKALTPEARRLVATLKLYAPVVKDLRQSAQAGLFPGIDYAIRRLQRGVPAAKTAVGVFGKAMGGLAAEGADRFTTPTFLRDFVTLSRQGASIITRFGRAIYNILEALLDFGIAARPFTNWLVNTVVGWTEFWKASARAGRETGSLAEKLRRSKESLIVLGHVLRNTWMFFKGLGRAARVLGDDLWDSAERATKAWSDYANSRRGQLRLMVQFAQMQDALHAMFRLVGALTRALWRMGTAPGLSRTLDSITRAVPVLERFLNTAARMLGEVLVRVLTEVLRLFEELVAMTGPINVFLGMAADLLGAFNDLLDRSKELRGVFIAVFQVFAISKFVGWAIKLAGALKAAAISASLLGLGGGVAGGRGVARGLPGLTTTGALTSVASGGAAAAAATWGTRAKGFGLTAARIGGLAALTFGAMELYRGFTQTSDFEPGKVGFLERLGRAGGHIGIGRGGMLAMFGPPGPTKMQEEASARQARYERGRASLDALLTRHGPEPTRAQVLQELAGFRAQRHLTVTTMKPSFGRNAIVREINYEIAARKRMVGTIDRERAAMEKGKSLNLAGRLLSQYGAVAKMMEGKGASQVDIAKYLRGKLLRDLKLPQLGPAGKQRLAEGFIKSLMGVEKGGKGGKGFHEQIKLAMRDVEKTFGTSKVNIDKHTGDIRKSSIENFRILQERISTHAERGNKNVTESFRRMKESAILMLADMGFSPAEARNLVARAERGQAVLAPAAPTVPMPTIGPDRTPVKAASGGSGAPLGGSGGGSLAPGLRGYFDMAMGAGFSNMGTYNPNSTLPSGRPSDHAAYPANAFDAGFSPATGWDNPQARGLFMALAGKPGIKYVILGDKIWSQSRGFHAYTYGRHEDHVHVSGTGGAGGVAGPLGMGGVQIGQIPVPIFPGTGLYGQIGQAASSLYGAGLTAAVNKQLGGVPWFGGGGTFTASRPTLIGVGEAGPETVSITPHGSKQPVALQIHIGKIENYREGDVRNIVKREIDAALNDLANEIDVVPMATVAL